jgi:hypothetical protein
MKSWRDAERWCRAQEEEEKEIALDERQRQQNSMQLVDSMGENLN